MAYKKYFATSNLKIIIIFYLFCFEIYPLTYAFRSENYDLSNLLSEYFQFCYPQFANLGSI